MSKGITKTQLALTEKKGRLVELRQLAMIAGVNIEVNDYIVHRIKMIDREIAEIQGRVPFIISREDRKLIDEA